MKKQKIAIGLLALTLIATVLAIAPSALAQGTSGASKPNFFQGLISFIEQKFGLSQAQVQSAIADYKNQVKPSITPRPTLTQTQILAQEKTKLDKLVSSGKLTSDQETAILNELSALWTKYNLNGLTGAQRRTQVLAFQNELRTWANSQNINLGYIMPFGGIGILRGEAIER